MRPWSSDRSGWPPERSAAGSAAEPSVRVGKEQDPSSLAGAPRSPAEECGTLDRSSSSSFSGERAAPPAAAPSMPLRESSCSSSDPPRDLPASALATSPPPSSSSSDHFFSHSVASISASSRPGSVTPVRPCSATRLDRVTAVTALLIRSFARSRFKRFVSLRIFFRSSFGTVFLSISGGAW
jgi:hypothetical protein